MKPLLFTDDDVAAVDREIEEAAAMATIALRETAPGSIVCQEPSDFAFEMELTEEELLDGFDAEPGKLLGETGEKPVRSLEKDLAQAAIHMAWLVPAVAFVLGFASGDPNGDAAWLTAPGLVLAGLVLARIKGKSPRGMAEFAFCIYAVSVARMVAAAIASGSPLTAESGMAAAGGVTLALCGGVIAAGFFEGARRQAHIRREPGFDGVV